MDEDEGGVFSLLFGSTSSSVISERTHLKQFQLSGIVLDKLIELSERGIEYLPSRIIRKHSGRTYVLKEQWEMPDDIKSLRLIIKEFNKCIKSHKKGIEYVPSERTCKRLGITYEPETR